MSDRMTPIPFGKLMETILKEEASAGSIFGVRRPYAHKGGALSFLGGRLETPFGPAAGPHTQLAQNIVAAYAGGARFFELKTVQTLDGEDLHVAKPCIDARDECYNVEWSTELRVQDALAEYVKAWYALKLIAKEFGLGSQDGFMFNMSVGYDFTGISSPKIDSFIEGLRDASKTDIWKECDSWARANVSLFKKVDAACLDSISAQVCGSITLSTLHGCPPQEIEKIATYLINKKHLHTFVKCNPTLLGYETARRVLDGLGFGCVAFDDHHFKEDLQYADAVAMFKRLQALADSNGVSFGVKLTNTCPVDNPQDVLAGGEMYMSGRSLFPLTAELARRLSAEFGGKLRISWSGGADATNVKSLFEAGIWPVTVATTLLKPGGYQRLSQMAEQFRELDKVEFAGVDAAAAAQLAKDVFSQEWYRKPVKPLPNRKTDKKVPLTDCFIAPCSEGCPIHQDIPGYVSLVGAGRHAEALRLILDKNPLPFITGTICSHRCMSKCTRNFYEESVRIRDAKLAAAQNGIEEVIKEIKPGKTVSDASVAIIGGGPAGLAAAYFLCRGGLKATVFEKANALGGVVRRIIPEFRISSEAIDADVQIARAAGAEFVLNAEKSSASELKEQGYKYVVFANGAWKHGSVKLEEGQALDVFDFLAQFKADPAGCRVGANVAVVGGGNTAMDAARAAVRVPGVKNVSLVYRRTKQFMPADEEELAMAVEDGVVFRDLLAPVSLANGYLKCAKVVLGAPDESARRAPVVTDEFVEVPADTVIAAVGETVDSELFTANGLKTGRRGLAEVSDELLASAENVYVAGDARRGAATVVEAIADARTVADAILKKEGAALSPAKAQGVCDLSGALAKKGVIEFADCAKCEAERCLECSKVCENCVDVCPNRANVSVRVPGLKQAQIVHIDSRCNECGNCTTFCPWNSAPYTDKFTLFDCEKDFADSSNSGFLALGGDSYKVRLEGGEFTAKLEDDRLPREISALIAAAAKQL